MHTHFEFVCYLRFYPWRKSLKKVLIDAEDDFLDFMEKVLEWDPEVRLTPTEAMGHVWLREYAEKRFEMLSNKL